MKKILKTIIASILVATMLICTVSASASAFSDINDSAFVPETAGYYFSRYEAEIDRECISCKENSSSVYIYYLETDESYPFREAPEFLGAEIVGISVSDPSVFDNLIIGVDVAEGGTSFNLKASVGLVFEGGKTIYTVVTPFVCENGVVAGENEVKFDIPNYDGESMTLTAYPLEEVIRSVDIKDKSYYTTAYIDYKDVIFFRDLTEATVVINGNQEIVANEYGYFVYSSRSYPLTICTEIPEDSPVKIKVYISGHISEAEIASFDCAVREASNSQNYERALYHFYVEIENLVNELTEKYLSMPRFLLALALPFMIPEYFAKAIPLAVEYFKDAMGFLGYNF